MTRNRKQTPRTRLQVEEFESRLTPSANVLTYDSHDGHNLKAISADRTVVDLGSINPFDKPPTITSASSTTFTVGKPGSFEVILFLLPTPFSQAPSISESGQLPAGVTFDAKTHVLRGNPAAGTGGTYAITFTATSAAGSSVQNFILTVNEAPQITSANATIFWVDSPSSFTITTAHDFPTATKLTENGALPSGVTFVDNGNGTATLAGTPAPGTPNDYDFTITASNGVSPHATQSFTLTVYEPATITSADSATFAVGTPGSFQVTATGFPVPTLAESGVTSQSTLPTGLTFNPTTGVLSGTPAVGTGGAYQIYFSAANAINEYPSQSESFTLPQSFSLYVDEAPTILSPNNATFTVGEFGNFYVKATGFPLASVSLSGQDIDGTPLPYGLQPGLFEYEGNFGDNTGMDVGGFAGTPGPGTGGVYHFILTVSNSLGSASQQFTLTVEPVPTVPAGLTITSANNATFTEGASGFFLVVVTGTPVPGIGVGGSALPSGLTLAQEPVEYENGVVPTSTFYALSGRPAPGTAGVYDITFTVGSYVQDFTLTILPAS
jgi:large repetitive protein